MIKRTFTLMVCILVLTLVMYRCKNKDAEPLTPDQGLVDELAKIDVEQVKLTDPAPVASTDAAITLSPAVTTLGTEIAGMGAGGAEPANVKASANKFATFFTKAEISALVSIKKEVLDAAGTTGKLPADLTAILARASASPEMAIYFPKVTLPTVAGKEIKGLRTGAVEGGPAKKFEGTLADDACLIAAEAEFEKSKAKLDASRLKLLASAKEKYDTEVKLIGDAQAACTASEPAKYAAIIKTAETLADQLNAALDANKDLLGDDYLPLKGIVGLQLIAYLTSLDELSKADLQACVAKGTAGTESASDAHDANKLLIENAYGTALEAAEKSKAKLVESCHNQGGGN
ncbi:hypothetical protein [Dyadobacter psychrophilus]|uniref:Uncharacterized protein n=1 Tax=Dyadobacter psychrophilus TaxID=651661 RepID=A0A1T5BVT2_9BACT|nr:hypothetical protein [Dyadobacter psychrophilus]SKB51093.1 hypothetical protein SAMN05660293_00632 [Dyadobacter psychrophilus]